MSNIDAVLSVVYPSLWYGLALGGAEAVCLVSVKEEVALLELLCENRERGK